MFSLCVGLPEEQHVVRSIGQLAQQFEDKMLTSEDKTGTIQHYFGLIQGYLLRNDDGDDRTDEFTYGKVRVMNVTFLLCSPLHVSLQQLPTHG